MRPFRLDLIFIICLLRSLSLQASGEEFDLKSPAHIEDLWGNSQIIRARCLTAKKDLVMLILEFDAPLQLPQFNQRNYALVKWIPENTQEVEINERILNSSGTIPAFGFHLSNFNLSSLLPNWNDDAVEGLRNSINRIAGSNVVGPLSQRNSTLLVMPFLSLIQLDHYIESYGSSERLVDQVRSFLEPVFDLMREEGITHGDLALRNAGVILNNKDEINSIVLYDFGGRNAGISDCDSVPYHETLDYLLELVRARISVKPRSTRNSNKLSTPEKNRNLPIDSDPTPLRKGVRKLSAGSPYAPNPENPKVKKRRRVEKEICSSCYFSKKRFPDFDPDNGRAGAYFLF